MQLLVILHVYQYFLLFYTENLFFIIEFTVKILFFAMQNSFHNG